MAVRTVPRAFWVLVAILVLVNWSRPSEAYPWMLKHEYTGCAVCHTDPSGGFLLTAYGRAQTQTLLSSFGRGPEGNEVDDRSQFLFGAIPLPESVNLGGSVRDLGLYTKPSGTSGDTRGILMQSDLRGKVDIGAFEAAGSLGYAHEGGQAAWITSRPQGKNLVSREFWVGYNIGDEKNTKVRAGRLYLPFGVRTMDHTLFVRNATRTDLDAQEQYGVSVFHGADNYRFEVMGILGNYQLRPDRYRERGYSAYAEYAAASRLGLGMSSLVTYQGESSSAEVTGAAIRGAHGPYARWAPVSSVALMGEWDLLHEQATGGGDPVLGFAGLLQGDWEYVRGLHATVTPELYLSNFQVGGDSLSYRGWLTSSWFVYPHLDLRLDAIYGRQALGNNHVDYLMALGQVHLSI